MKEINWLFFLWYDKSILPESLLPLCACYPLEICIPQSISKFLSIQRPPCVSIIVLGTRDATRNKTQQWWTWLSFPWGVYSKQYSVSWNQFLLSSNCWTSGFIPCVIWAILMFLLTSCLIALQLEMLVFSIYLFFCSSHPCFYPCFWFHIVLPPKATTTA